MTTATQTAPDEETPLLGGRQAPTVGRATESESGAATVASPLNQGGRTPSITGKTNANGGSEVVEKTSLPWAQLSVVLLLQLSEPMALYGVYPVSSPVNFSYPFALALVDTNRKDTTER